VPERLFSDGVRERLARFASSPILVVRGARVMARGQANPAVPLRAPYLPDRSDEERALVTVKKHGAPGFDTNARRRIFKFVTLRCRVDELHMIGTGAH
jgi:hypothetical protein